MEAIHELNDEATDAVFVEESLQWNAISQKVLVS